MRENTGFPFGFAQGGESFDSAQDREPVERLVEPRFSPEWRKESVFDFLRDHRE